MLCDLEMGKKALVAQFLLPKILCIAEECDFSRTVKKLRGFDSLK